MFNSYHMEILSWKDMIMLCSISWCTDYFFCQRNSSQLHIIIIIYDRPCVVCITWWIFHSSILLSVEIPFKCWQIISKRDFIIVILSDEISVIKSVVLPIILDTSKWILCHKYHFHLQNLMCLSLNITRHHSGSYATQL